MLLGARAELKSNSGGGRGGWKTVAEEADEVKETRLDGALRCREPDPTVAPVRRGLRRGVAGVTFVAGTDGDEECATS